MSYLKIYNKKESIGYAPLPEISPYSRIDNNRLKKTKFIYRKANEFIKSHIKNPIDWVDIGTANGEFIFYLSNLWKKTKFLGIDITPEFVSVAKKLNKNFKNTKFLCNDIFKIDTKMYKSDVVTCLGTFPIFPNPKNILNKLLNLVKSKGILLIHGRFNPYNISAQIKFNDESKKISKNLWRCDFNLHSEKSIRKILDKRTDIKNIKFRYPIMDTNIKKKKNEPDINVWTIPRQNGGYNITNGLQIIYQPSFLIIKKK